VVKKPVGVRATLVDAFLGLLDKLPVSALDTVRELARLVVDLGVVEQVPILAELGCGHPSVALVVEVALLGVGKQTIRFRTVET